MDNNIEVIQVDESNMEEEHIRRFLPLPNSKAYHVFLSYRGADYDRQWVQEIIEKLEKTYQLKCCNHVTDFKPGLSILENIGDAITSSVKTLIILSKGYSESPWCKHEAEYTHIMSMDLREKIFIPVLIQECEIPDHLKPFTYIDARGPINQWLPRLVSAIKEPVNCVPDSKYAQQDFDTRYKNFETVHVEKTTFRWCGCCGKLPFKPGSYIPDSLSSKVFNLTHHEYLEILRVIADTTLIKYRHTCQPLRRVLRCIIFVWVILFVFGYLFINGLVYSNGNHTTNVLGLVATVFCFLIIIAYLIMCAAKGTCLKRSSIFPQLNTANRLLINHNLLAGLKFHCFDGTVEVIFIYFDHLPCLKGLTEYLKIAHKLNGDGISRANAIELENSHPSTSGGGYDDVPLNKIYMSASNISQQIGVSGPFNREGETWCNQSDGKDVSNQTDDTYFTEKARDLLGQMAPDFVWDFLNEKLGPTKSGMHSTRVVCVCEYVKTRDEDSKKQSDEASSKLQLLHCCCLLKLIPSPELPNANKEEEIIVV